MPLLLALAAAILTFAFALALSALHDLDGR